MKRVEILEVIQHLPRPGIARGHLDLPKSGSESLGFSINLLGWVLSSDGPPDSIEMITEWFKSRVPTLIRPDLQTAFPSIEGAATGGFHISISSLRLPPEFELRIQAHFSKGKTIDVAIVRGRRKSLASRSTHLWRPLMITTLGRTGSTRVVQILAHHPSIVGYRPGEYEPRIASYWANVLLALANPISYHQALDGDINNDKWWLGVGRLRPLPRGFFDAQIEELHAGASIEKLAAFCQKQIDDFYRRVASLQKQSQPGFFVEKTQPGAVPTMLWDLYPSAREIILVRDMRDMVSSILAFNAKRGFAAFGRESVSSDEEFIRNLRPAVLQIVNSWRQRSGRAYLLRYEDVVLRPEETLRHVVDYLGLQADEQGARRMLEYAGATGEAPERHRTTENAAKSVGRWQRDLDPELQKLCAETFGDLLPVLGYE